ncbi:MAG TPA: hypothetical protein VHP11_01460 [Tepidisphaeraceae bacterium]|nr:hypothetical protein [Tepidisphaeraceae bacterium]
MLVAHVSTSAHDSPHGANQTIRGLCRHWLTLTVRAERWLLDTSAMRLAGGCLTWPTIARSRLAVHRD